MGAARKYRRDTPFDALVASAGGVVSDRELSRRTGVARQTFVDIRTGARVPRVHVVERLAATLGLDVGAVVDVVAQTVRDARARRSAQ